MQKKFEESKNQFETFLKQLFTKHQDDHKIFTSNANYKNVLNLDNFIPGLPKQNFFTN